MKSKIIEKFSRTLGSRWFVSSCSNPGSSTDHWTRHTTWVPRTPAVSSQSARAHHAQESQQEREERKRIYVLALLLSSNVIVTLSFSLLIERVQFYTVNLTVNKNRSTILYQVAIINARYIWQKYNICSIYIPYELVTHIFSVFLLGFFKCLTGSFQRPCMTDWKTPCKFPFKYLGKTYNSCTKDGGMKTFWCATEVDSF